MPRQQKEVVVVAPSALKPSVKINRRTHHLLRLITASSGQEMLEVLDRLVQQEAERIYSTATLQELLSQLPNES